MNNDLISKYFQQLKNAESITEINTIIEHLAPLIKQNKVSIKDLILYLKFDPNEIHARSQDHRNSISNSTKAQIILEKLMAKLKENE